MHGSISTLINSNHSQFDKFKIHPHYLLQDDKETRRPHWNCKDKRNREWNGNFSSTEFNVSFFFFGF